METTELASVALLAIHEQRLGMALAPEARWQDLYGQRAARLELPSAAHLPGADAESEALALARSTYGRAASPLPTRWTYGPSPRHAVDRSTATATRAAPFLRFERMLPMERDTHQPPRLVVIEVYRAALAGGSVALDPASIAALLWLPLAALRALVGGARLGDALALDGVEAEVAQGVRLPSDALVFLPSDYGERHLLRIAAKYGESALFA